jgi:hypothetical protein
VTSAGESEAVYVQLETLQPARTGFLISLNEVPVLGTGLVMLQGEPTERFGERTDSDRAQAGELRSFAYNLIRTGAQAVLTLPTLPDLIVPDVLTRVASALEGGSLPSVARLLDAAGAARRLISSAAARSDILGTDESSLLEAALDVCVFVRSERAIEQEYVEQAAGEIAGVKISSL